MLTDRKKATRNWFSLSKMIKGAAAERRAGNLMFYRIKQFVAGVMAQGPNSEERLRIEKILPPKARELFYKKNVAVCHTIY